MAKDTGGKVNIGGGGEGGNIVGDKGERWSNREKDVDFDI